MGQAVMFSLKVDNEIELGLLEQRHAQLLLDLTVQSREHLREWMPVLGNLKLQDITGPDINRVLDGMRKQELAPATVRLAYAVMHKVFEDAIDEHELLTTSPVRKKYRPVVRQTERPFLPPTEATSVMRRDSSGRT